MGKLVNEIGNIYSRLTVVARAANQDTTAAWHCVCDCGNKVTIIGKKLRNGHTKSCGCYRKEVSAKEQGYKNKLSKEVIVNRLKENGYELLSDYVRSDARATMKCVNCDLIFTRRLDASLYKTSGCPSCSKSLNGFIGSNYFAKNLKMKNVDCKLYLIEFEGNNEHFWKIGITRRTVERRIGKIPYTGKIVKVIQKTMQEVYEIEKSIKTHYRSLRYLPQLKFNGHSECFKVPPEIA